MRADLLDERAQFLSQPPDFHIGPARIRMGIPACHQQFESGKGASNLVQRRQTASDFFQSLNEPGDFLLEFAPAWGEIRGR